MADSVRQRKGKPTPKKETEPFDAEESAAEDEAPAEEPVSVKERIVAEETDRFTIFLDVLRVITFLFAASCALSYLVSNGETFFWGMQHPPKYLQTKWWKSQLVRSFGRLVESSLFSSLSTIRHPSLGFSPPDFPRGQDKLMPLCFRAALCI